MVSQTTVILLSPGGRETDVPRLFQQVGVDTGVPVHSVEEALGESHRRGGDGVFVVLPSTDETDEHSFAPLSALRTASHWPVVLCLPEDAPVDPEALVGDSVDAVLALPASALQVRATLGGAIRSRSDAAPSSRGLAAVVDPENGLWNSNLVLVAVLDRDLRFVRVNEAYADVAEWTPDAFVGKGHFELYPHAENEEIFREVLESGVPYHARARPFEHPQVDATKFTYWDWDLHPIPGGSGGAEGLILTLVDATERVHTAVHLSRQEDELATVEQMARLGRWELDFESGSVTTSECLRSIMGISAERAGVEDIATMVHPEDRPGWDAAFRKAAEGEASVVTSRCAVGDGSCTVLAWLRPARNPEGGIVGVRGVLQDVTERTEVERRLRESQKRLQEARRIARQGDWEWDVTTGALTWSTEVYRILGRSPESFTPSFESFLTCVHGDDRESLKELVAGVLEGGEPLATDFRAIHPDGATRWVHTEAEVYRHEDGRSLRILGIVSDVTEIREAEARARNLARIIDSSMNEVLVFDAETSLLSYMNLGAMHNLGYGAEDPGELTPWDLMPEFSAEGFDDLLEPLRNGTMGWVEFATAFRRKDGSRYPAEVSLEAATYKSRPAYVAFVLDVTNRRDVERRLEESEARLLEAQRIARIGHWEWVVDTGNLFWSEEIYRIFGLNPETHVVSYEGFLEAIHSEDRDEVVAGVQGALDGEKEYGVSHRIVRPDGSIRWVYERGEVFRDAEGRPVRMVGTVQDITEARHAQESLVRSEARMRSLFDESPLGLSFYDADTRLVDVNPAGLDMMGLNDLPEGPASNLLPNPHIGPEAEERIRRGEVVRFEVSFDPTWSPEDGGVGPEQARSPGVKDFSVIVVPVGAREGLRPQGYFLITEDVTETKNYEHRMRESLKEKELLLQEVHHRVKNNLQVISSLLRLQGRHVTDGHYLSMLQASRNRIQSMAMVHEELYRQDNFAVVDMRRYITRIAQGLLVSYERPGISLATELNEVELGIDQAVPMGLLVNELVSNSLKHAFPGDTSGTVRVIMGHDSEGRVVVTVSDNGIGFSEDPGEEPASLGMYLIRSLVGQLEGELDVTVHEGTTFRVVFPATEGQRELV